MKFEWKKQEKSLYTPKDTPTIIKVPKQKFFMIKGKGNPNSEDFSKKIEVLYSMAYAVRMMPKNGYIPEGYFEYTVYPLEGIWDLTEDGKKQDTFNKDELVYTIMIRQPDFVNDQVVSKAFEIVSKKKPSKLLNEIEFKELEDGLCVQMLHIGSYDEEPESFAKMKSFIQEQNLQRTKLFHREIYLSDARKVEKDKLKTVLRYFVEKK